MCTTIFNYIKDVSDKSILIESSKKNNLITIFDNIYPQKNFFNKKIILNEYNGISFLLFENTNSGCSCSIINKIQEYSINKNYLLPNIFNFYLDLNKNFGINNIYSFFSQDIIKDINQIKIINCSYYDFKEYIIKHYGWKNNDELKTWNYDLNTIFNISDFKKI